ncbi:plasmid stabilization protein, partial [Streptomyces sp. WAC07061]|uniref:Rho termination factor N-terminal domain-containing protein n=1 Tax=Streptomyces sp. WAC07061 TaxID=2487410 RepID=UPI000F95690B
TQGKSASQRGGQRSGGGGSSDRTKDELYQEAKERNIEGRSTMTKQQLKNALGH